MAAASQATPDRIAQLLRVVLSTDKPGESSAAIAALHRVLGSSGFDLHDIADAVVAGWLTPDEPPQPPRSTRSTRPNPADYGGWRQLVYLCLRRSVELTERDRAFLENLKRYRGEPTPKQKKWLCDIAERLAIEEAA